MSSVAVKFDRPVVGSVTLKMVVERLPLQSRHPWDCSVDTAQRRYAEGVDYADKCDYLTISLGNVWGGKAGNADISSYEKIGYHAGSTDFMLGAIAEGCPVYVAWETDDGYVWKSVVI